jgi:hypothetical protein
MEKVDGVPLNDVWDTMPFDSKVDLQSNLLDS